MGFYFILFQNALSISGTAKVSHSPYPGIRRQRMLAQTLGRTVHPDTTAGQPFPGLHAARPDDLARGGTPIIGQSISFSNPEGGRLSTKLDWNCLATKAIRFGRIQRPQSLSG